MSSAAALLIPGCACCEKIIDCLCADLDLAAGIGLRVNVPNVMPDTHGGGYPGDDPFYEARESWWKLPDWARWSADGCTPRIVLGGCGGYSYGLRFTVKYCIDRGTYFRPTDVPYYWGADPWPQYQVEFRAAYQGPIGDMTIVKSTGESMPLSFIDGEVTTAFFGAWGPVLIILWWAYFRYSAGCYAEITNIECAENEVANSGFKNHIELEWIGAGFGGGAGSITQSFVFGFSDACSLEVKQTNTVGYYFANQSLILTPFAHYQVRARVFLFSDNVPNVRASLFLGAFSNNLTLSADLTILNSWQTLECLDWSPGADANGALNLEVETTDATDAIVLFDDIEVFQIP